MGVWRDEEYLQLKAGGHDKREIMPICIKSVSVRNYIDTCVYTNVHFFRKFEGGTQVKMVTIGTIGQLSMLCRN